MRKPISVKASREPTPSRKENLCHCTGHDRSGRAHRDTTAARRDRCRDVVVIHASPAAALCAVARARQRTRLVAHERSLVGHGGCGAVAFPTVFETDETIGRGWDRGEPGFCRGHAEFERHGIVGRHKLHGFGAGRLDVAAGIIETVSGPRRNRGGTGWAC